MAWLFMACLGRIQKRKTKLLQIIILGLQRAAGPYRWAIRKLMHRSKFGRLCGAFNAYIDFAPERPEVDWFCQQRLSTVCKRPSLSLRVAIGRNHDDRDLRSQCPCLR